MTTGSLIDVHHHMIPPVFAEALASRGIAQVAGAPLPAWSPTASLELIDAAQIELAVLSLSAPGVSFVGPTEAPALARACNEYAHSVCSEFPDRLGYFAVLPMPFTQAACAEAIYALEVLGAKGVGLLASTDGIFLGDPNLEELLQVLDAKGAIAFVHPNLHPTTASIDLKIPGFMIEFPCDTTRAAANLVLSGCMERYPNIRWILSHAGGFLPYVSWRLSLAEHLDAYAGSLPKGVMAYIRNFFFDTALSPSPAALRCLLEVADPRKILFGSDYPFAPAHIAQVEAGMITGSPVLGELGLGDQVRRENALTLFNLA